MILLDTDHLSVLKYEEHPQCRTLRERMTASEDPVFATTIISAEEQMRGWLAKIHAAKDPEKQVAWYDQLAWLIEFLAVWEIIAFDQQAAVEFETSTANASSHRHIGSQDRCHRTNSRRSTSLGKSARFRARAGVTRGELDYLIDVEPCPPCTGFSARGRPERIRGECHLEFRLIP